MALGVDRLVGDGLVRMTEFAVAVAVAGEAVRPLVVAPATAVVGLEAHVGSEPRRVAATALVVHENHRLVVVRGDPVDEAVAHPHAVLVAHLDVHPALDVAQVERLGCLGRIL